MSDNNNKSKEQTKEKAMLKAESSSDKVPPQKSPRDTSNWDNKVSVDPNGEKNIRSDQSYKPKE
jgi:hypothetical protein